MIKLTLKPDKIPLTTSNATEEVLVVTPGEKSQMTLSVQNPVDETLQIENFEIIGNFPQEWCSWNLEGREIYSRKTMLVGIYFDVPQNWIEDRSLDKLQLNYQATVNISLQYPGSSDRELQKYSFNFCIRPDSLYLNFLPNIYREIDFVGRLLKVFEEAFEPTVNAFEVMWAYLDPLTTPESLLPFLAHWVGWEILNTIPLERQRYLIRNAISIYRWRGTKKGLRFYLHLYTGLPLDEELPEREKHICIEEAVGEGFVLGRGNLAENTILGGGRPYHFTVRLRSTADNLLDENLIRKIIDLEKPIWCTYSLNIEY